MSICSGRWWCGACPEPTSCLFTSTSIHQSGILIYRPSKRLGSSSSTTHSHLSKQLTQTHAVSQSCFTSPIGRGQMVALQYHGLQSGFWIGLDWIGERSSWSRPGPRLDVPACRLPLHLSSRSHPCVSFQLQHFSSPVSSLPPEAPDDFFFCAITSQIHLLLQRLRGNTCTAYIIYKKE